VNEDDDCNSEFAFTTSCSLMKNTLFIDSGATSHMTNSREFFTYFDPTKIDKITLANGEHVKSIGIGDGYVYCSSLGKEGKLLIKDVMYVPELESRLPSVKVLTKAGYVVTFKGNTCTIENDSCLVAVGKIENNLYELVCDERANVVKHAEHHENCIHLWHRRMGHRNPEAVKKLCKENLAKGIILDVCDARIKCTSCVKGKMAKKTFKRNEETLYKQPLDLIHSDVCGPMNTQTPGHKKYFLTFIDDYSIYTTVYLLHSKCRAHCSHHSRLSLNLITTAFIYAAINTNVRANVCYLTLRRETNV
jgi:hypothetical protein